MSETKEVISFMQVYMNSGYTKNASVEIKQLPVI